MIRSWLGYELAGSRGERCLQETWKPPVHLKVSLGQFNYGKASCTWSGSNPGHL